MTYGIRNKSTGQWCENSTFGTRADAEAHLKAQYHQSWIECHEVCERSGE